jgi:hypothetical protein
MGLMSKDKYLIIQDGDSTVKLGPYAEEDLAWLSKASSMYAYLIERLNAVIEVVEPLIKEKIREEIIHKLKWRARRMDASEFFLGSIFPLFFYETVNQMEAEGIIKPNRGWYRLVKKD